MTDTQLTALRDQVTAELARRRRCLECDAELSGRAHARYCGTRCRVRAHRARSLPSELTSRARWLRHSDRKVPLSLDGHAVDATDPNHWNSYAAARASCAGDGLGFALNGDGVACWDYDHLLTDGTLDPRVAAHLDSIDPFYVEVSPSGTGLHAWVITAERPTRVRHDIGGGLIAEFYWHRRYITVTGRRWTT